MADGVLPERPTRLRDIPLAQREKFDRALACLTLDGETCAEITRRVNEAFALDLVSVNVSVYRTRSRSFQRALARERDFRAGIAPSPDAVRDVAKVPVTPAELLVWAKDPDNALRELTKMVVDAATPRNVKVQALALQHKIREDIRRDDLDEYRLTLRAAFRDLLEAGYSPREALELLHEDTQCLDPAAKNRLMLELELEVDQAHPTTTRGHVLPPASRQGSA